MRPGRLLPPVLAALLLLGAPAWGHPFVTDDHNACLIVGWDALGPRPQPLVVVTGPLSEWQGHTSTSYPSNLCVPPGSAISPSQGADWASHAASCLGVPAGVAVSGAYCGGPTGGTFTCVTAEVPGWPGFGIVVGVDANGDGRVNQLDNALYPSGAASVTEVIPAGGVPTAYSGPTPFGTPFISGTGAFPPGRLIAYVTSQGGGPGSGTVAVACS